MKTVSIEITNEVGKIRVPAGKGYGFWGKVFIPSRVMIRLREWAGRCPIYAVVDRDEKGWFIKDISQTPVVYYEPQDMEAVLEAARQGVAVWEDDRYRGAYQAVMKSDKREEMVKLCAALYEKRMLDEYKTKTVEEIIALADKEENEDDGQALPYSYHIGYLKQAVKAGVSGAQEKLKEYEERYAEWERKAEQVRQEGQRQRNEHTARQENRPGAGGGGLEKV